MTPDSMAYWTAMEIVGPGGTEVELNNAARTWERVYANNYRLLQVHALAFKGGSRLLRHYLGLRN